MNGPSGVTNGGRRGKAAGVVGAAVLLLLAGMLTASVVVGAQDGTGADSRAGTGSIGGYVTDMATSSAISGATVQLINASSGAPITSGSTDLGGWYDFINLDPGTYNLTITAANYMTKMMNGNAVVNLTQTTVDVALMGAASTVDGTVTDAQAGTPLAGVLVVLNQETPAGVATTTQTDTTDAAGMYSFATSDRRADIVFSAAGFTGATMADVLIGLNTTVTRNAALDRTMGTVWGEVRSQQDGTPVDGAAVTLQSSSLGTMTGTTNASGGYAINAYWGDYTLTISKIGYFASMTSVSVVAAMTTQADVLVEATPPLTATVFGLITDCTSGGPLASALVTFEDQDRPDRALAATTDAQGAFSLQLYAGFFMVVVTASGYKGISSFLAVNEDDENLPWDGCLDVLPVPDATISGTVLSGATPVPGATVKLLLDGQEVAATTADPGGLYSLPARRGTTVSLWAWASGYFAKTVAGLAVSSATVNQNISLLAIPPMNGEVSGVVEDGATGAFISGASVTLTDRDATHGMYTARATTNANGGFSIMTYNGSFVVAIDAAGYQGEVQTLTVAGVKFLGRQSLDQTPTQSTTVSYTFDSFNDVKAVWESPVTADAALTRWTIDRDFGNADLVVTAGEVDAWKARLAAKGAPFRKSTDRLTLDGHSFTVNASSFAVELLGVEGNITDTDDYTMRSWAMYGADGQKADAPHALKLNIHLDTLVMAENYVVTVPTGYEVRTWDAAAADVTAQAGSSTVDVDPHAASGGMDWAWITLNITGNDAPVAKAGSNRTVKSNEAIKFSAVSSTDDKGIINYTWDFGDGGMGYGEKVEHNFTLAATEDLKVFTLTLSVRDSAGLTNSTQITVTVDGEDPTADFSTNLTDLTVVEDKDMAFNSTSSDNNGGRAGIAHWSWNFGDGAFGENKENVSHKYADPGEYSVNLTVTDKAGYTAWKVVKVKVLDTTPPAPQIEGATQATTEQDITFSCEKSTDNSIKPGGNFTLTCLWRWDDNSTDSPGAEVKHNWSTARSNPPYKVNLTVTDAAGNKAYRDWNIIVTKRPANIDLEIVSMDIDKKQPTAQDRVTVKLVIKNKGSENIPGDFQVTLKDGTSLADKAKVSALPANSTRTVNLVWIAQEGKRTLKVHVDSEGQVQETDEGNNQKSEQITVQRYLLPYIAIAAVALAVVTIAVWAMSRRQTGKRRRRLEE